MHRPNCNFVSGFLYALKPQKPKKSLKNLKNLKKPTKLKNLNFKKKQFFSSPANFYYEVPPRRSARLYPLSCSWISGSSNLRGS